MPTIDITKRLVKGSSLTWAEMDANLQKLYDMAIILSGSGWTKYSNGLILQTGNTNTVTGREDLIYFPMAFPGGVGSIVITEGNASGWHGNNLANPYYRATIYGASTLTPASFKVSCTWIEPSGPLAGPNCNFSYIALGW